MPTYAALRFIAGVGLAGELGAGITLVSEILPKEVRGYGTTIVASVGIMGAVVAVLVGDAFDWRIAYIVGGVMGLALLVLRIGVFESGMFEGVKQTTVARGNFFALFANPARTRRYLSVVLVGLPIWYVIGILITFAPELGAARRRDADAPGGARGALRLPGPDGRRPRQRAAQPVDAQPQARAGAVPRHDAGVHPRSTSRRSRSR